MQVVVQKYFDDVASDWDGMRSRYFPERLAQKALQRVELQRQMTVADIGTGTGFMALAAASHVQRVIGVDMSRNMLAVAKENAMMRGFRHITFQQGSAEAIPLPNAAVDVVFTNMMMHHVVHPPLAIKEIARVLKPGGSIVISDVDSHPFEWAKAQMSDVWLGFPRETMLTWLAAAGFGNLEIGWSGCNCRGQSPAGEEVAVSIFIASGTKTHTGEEMSCKQHL